MPPSHRLLPSVGYLLATMLFANSGYAQNMRAPELDQIVNLQVEDGLFQDTIKALSGQTGLVIVYHGSQPSAKQDVSIRAIPLHEAIERVMSAYAVPNHLAISTFDGNVLKQIDIYGLSSMPAPPPTVRHPGPVQEDGEMPLTKEQIDQMADQSLRLETEMEENARALTSEQTDILQEKNASEEDQQIESEQALTPEQLEIVRAKSELIEIEETSDQSLTRDQLLKLRANSLRIQIEAQQEDRPLTSDQRKKLMQDSELK